MKQAIILMNLGTPSAPTAKAVRAFLNEFLSDPRVVEVPRPIWWVILKLIILPFRSPKVAHAYESIWQPGGSPLRIITESQVEKLQQRLLKASDSNIKVTHAMTYSGPSLASVVSQLEEEGYEKILLFPLYPQYSATTTGSIYDQWSNIIKKRRNIPDIHLIKHYYQHPLYIRALAVSVESHWREHGQCERLLISFHGIPKRNVELGDPYFDHCKITAKLLAEHLSLTDQQWALSFQSRLGRAEWLKPYTSDLLEEWGKEGVKHVDVICPAFSSDCLETLEEIAVENRDIFLGSGGEKYQLIPCLNDSDIHIEMMEKIVTDHIGSAEN